MYVSDLLRLFAAGLALFWSSCRPRKHSALSQSRTLLALNKEVEGALPCKWDLVELVLLPTHLHDSCCCLTLYVLVQPFLSAGVTVAWQGQERCFHPAKNKTKQGMLLPGLALKTSVCIPGISLFFRLDVLPRVVLKIQFPILLAILLGISSSGASLFCKRIEMHGK